MGKQFAIVKLVILSCLLMGCLATKINVSGDYIMVEHEAHKSGPAYNKAQEVCEAKGMDVKLEGIACPHFCVSTYKCLPKNK